MGKKRADRIEQPEQKASREAAARAYAARRTRRTVLLWSGVLVAVVTAAALGYRYYQQSQLLSTVTTATYPAGQHMAGPVTHKENPPVGGMHNPAWQNCGSYDEPIHNEHAVHSLEHGAVWITYRPGLPADQVTRLKEIAADEFMLLSPYPGLDVPVVASSWNHQIRLDGADDPRLPAFIEEYRNNPATTPEFGASCFGAIVTTAANTDTLTNPQAGLAR